MVQQARINGYAGAYWFLDEIAIIQPHDKCVAAEEFQVWKLVVRSDSTGVLTCEDGNGNIVFSKEIEYTDFPLDEISLWFANNVIYLPSEHCRRQFPRRIARRGVSSARGEEKTNLITYRSCRSESA
jgi:hypothetical protein